jgi:methionine-rich copper-binding protein CopC
MKSWIFAAALMAGLGVGTAPAAHAHSKVVSSMPAQGANVSAPKTVVLNFSEALIPPTASVAIVMTAMPGVKNHSEMVIRNFTQSWADNNRSWTLKLRQPLRTGSYDIRWQAAGADGHRMKGTVNFTVK